MDTKPQRPFRSLRIRTDENANPPMTSNGTKYKTLHHRNKSTPALASIANAGGLRNAVKRTAFGDLSNTVNNSVRKAQDDSSVSAQVASKPIVLSSRPAQRPVSAALTKGSNSAPQGKENVPAGISKQQNATAKHTVVRKQSVRHNVVFKDSNAGPKPPSQKRERVEEPSLIDPRIKDERSQSIDHAQESALVNTGKLPAIPERKSSSFDRDTESVTSDSHQSKTSEPPVSVESVVPDKEDKPAEFLKPAVDVAIPVATEENPAVPPAPVRDAPTAAKFDPITLPSEPDEYWDEDDESNDEDDGYFTGRSHRSRGDNTTGGASLVLFPRVTQAAKREIALATQIVEATRTVEDVEDEAWDTSMVAEYGDEIFQYMREMEIRLLPNAHYMDNQYEIQWSMRSVLMDWLVQVHLRFSLLPETLFLCINLIDRFLSCKVVSLAKLQLVGATAIFIAAKYEEINCPSLQEIVYMVDNGYDAEEILKAERFMLTMLQFELGWPGPMSFLRRISKADEYDFETRTLAKYFLELTIMDERFVGSPPSFTAAGAHCLARLMLHKGTWSPAHVYYSNYTYIQLYPLVSLMLECCEAPRAHHPAIYEKYADRRFKRASFFVEGEIMRGFTLPEPRRESGGAGCVGRRASAYLDRTSASTASWIHC